jgi:holo-[acyl-carrier protein] synthase
MILGVGIDLAEISRIEHACEKEHFRRRIFSESENARIDERGWETAAGIFAAKEAVAKALGTGFSAGIGFHDIEVVTLAGGRPELRLHGRAREAADALGVRAAHVSLSHERDMACAMVILEG